ncbi:MAG: Gfo/Idh/MocA family protein [Planctomycetota bacterium]|jgi:predicted dehydrogenase
MCKTNEKDTSRREFLKKTSRIAASSAFIAAVGPRIYAGEDNTIKVALVGCGGRGAGAAVNALATKSGPIKLVAMADVFEDRLKRSYSGLIAAASDPRMSGSADSWVMDFRADQVDVPPERRFLGFDAYQKAIDCLGPSDVVILTTPVAFRWVHFSYAIKKGINVFMEKPVIVDGPSTRKMLQLAEESSKKNLKVGVGLMCRHCKARWALYDRIKSGQIGDLLTLRTYRQQGPAGFTGPNRSNVSELLWQIRNYLSFMWASGGLVQDYVAHNVDECCWMKDVWPIRAQGSGGRCHRGGNVDQNYDHYDVEYTFADGAKLFLYARNIVGCRGEFASYAHGTKGSAVISTHMHTPGKCCIYKGQDFAKGNLIWAFPQPEPNPYQLEWDDLIDAIRNDKRYNETKSGTEASLVTAMGRRAVHTGQIVTYDEMLNCDEEFASGVDRLTMDSPAPVQAGPDGRYPAPQPGLLKNREY